MWKTNRRAVVQQLIRLVFTGILLAPCILFGTLLQGSPAEGWSWTGVVCAALFFASVLVFFGWMLYAAHRYSRTAWFRIGGFAVLFVWVFVTLFCFSHLDEGIVEGGLAYRLLEVFNRASTVFLSRGKDLAQGAGAGAVVNAWLLRLAIVGYLVSMMFSMMGRRVFNRLRVSLTCARHKNVFWGLSERELLLARSIVEGSCWDQVQFNLPVDKSCDPSSLARLMDLADEIDAFWMFVDFGRLSREKGCHHGGRHFFLGEDGHANLALANKVTEAFLDDPHACCETVLYVRVGDIDNEALFSAWAHGVYERSAHLVRPVLVHEPEMIARKYVEQYPPLASKTLAERIDTSRATVREASCRTLLLGFDHTGRALLNAQLCQSGFILPDGRSPVAFPITVVDMVQARWDRYGLQAPEIVANRADHALDFKCLQVGMPAFESWFRDVHGAFDRIVFCLKGDGVNIREALRMRELLIQLGDVDKELIVRVESPALNESVRLRETDVLPLKYFGKLDDIYSVGFMNGDPVDRIARYLNWQWNVNRDLEQDGAVARLIHERDKMQIKEQSDDVARYWEGSTYYERLSSRASAMAGLSSCVFWAWTGGRPGRSGRMTSWCRSRRSTAGSRRPRRCLRAPNTSGGARTCARAGTAGGTSCRPSASRRSPRGGGRGGSCRTGSPSRWPPSARMRRLCRMTSFPRLICGWHGPCTPKRPSGRRTSSERSVPAWRRGSARLRSSAKTSTSGPSSPRPWSLPDMSSCRLGRMRADRSPSVPPVARTAPRGGGGCGSGPGCVGCAGVRTWTRNRSRGT